ncbi:MAG: hypothetical protein A3F70_04570 [Acidobacteria bacterium RIFCSPLOWO2_12_FULL_67_14]|nr:MAG: hypothetical protein A3F70_04570 [Acidobacteria bacterium RIFCSPLOWO2_12_FULL_67_14]
MDEQLSRWLGLREAADARARSDRLTRVIVDSLPAAGPIHVVDLATGTGANVRYLSPRLPSPQRWLAVDRSADLLDELRGKTTAPGCAIEVRQVDLGSLTDHSIFAGQQLVTASALLDLVSEPWLQALAWHCREEGASALFTITYNGRSSCDPPDLEDAMVRELFNRHQHRDKRLGGPAAGPDAVDATERCFTKAGYRVAREPSDWVLEPESADMQRMLIDGWAEAATEVAPDRASRIADWRGRRLAHVDARRSHLTVGHDDLAAWLPRTI